MGPPCVARSGMSTADVPLIARVPDTVVTAPIAIVFAGLFKPPNVAIVLRAPKCPSEPVPLFDIVTEADIDGTELANGNHSMRKTSSNQDDASGLHILVVNYTNEVNPTDEEMSSQVKEYAPVFSNENFPGMIGKTMINSTDGNIYGGVYYFTSRSAIDDYLISELWTGFEGDNNTNVYKKDIYMVAPISTISNGVPVL